MYLSYPRVLLPCVRILTFDFFPLLFSSSLITCTGSTSSPFHPLLLLLLPSSPPDMQGTTKCRKVWLAKWFPCWWLSTVAGVVKEESSLDLVLLPAPCCCTDSLRLLWIMTVLRCSLSFPFLVLSSTKCVCNAMFFCFVIYVHKREIKWARMTREERKSSKCKVTLYMFDLVLPFSPLMHWS